MSRIVILGGGESGVGTALLAHDRGHDVFLSDAGKLAPHYKAELDSEGIAYEEGRHTADLILNADEVVKSPGIPLTAPMVASIAEKGIPIISEMEFAGRYSDAKMVCITGSNGKTTTTMLTCAMLRGAGVDASTAGNIGRSLARQIAREPHDCYVIELSSFQLDNMYTFRANVGVVLNITPDHLDRYDYKFENYARAKMRIGRNQTSSDYFVYWNGDEPTCRLLGERGGDGTILTFGLQPQGPGAWIDGDRVRISVPAGCEEIERAFLLADLPLAGEHNLRNAMAASLACVAAFGEKLDWAGAVRGMNGFGGVEHRLEPAGEIDGVKYINDSKATNVDSTYYALGSMDRPTVLILGGKDKGNDYTQIEALVKDKVKAIVCMGLHNEKLMEFFGGKVAEIYDTHSLADAMDTARNVAAPGDTVLLSPCCASFDLFSSYEDRGRQFKSWVAEHKS